MHKSENEDVAIEHAVDRLTSQFPSVPAQVIQEEVDDVHASFDEAPIRDFVPVIVEHDVREHLREDELPASQRAFGDVVSEKGLNPLEPMIRLLRFGETRAR